jgi:hypothetical protein
MKVSHGEDLASRLDLEPCADYAMRGNGFGQMTPAMQPCRPVGPCEWMRGIPPPHGWGYRLPWLRHYRLPWLRHYRLPWLRRYRPLRLRRQR